MSFRRGSILSVSSRMTFMDDEPHFEDLTDDELRDTLEQAIQHNRYLQLENEIFERYLQRHDPQSVQVMTQVLESAKHAQRVASQMIPIASALSLTSEKLGRGTSMSGSTLTFTGSRRTITNQILPRGFRISISHRIEMAENEIAEMRKSLGELETLAAKTRANLRAQMEEVDLRIRETNEARAELEENVVKNGVDPLTGRIPAEKFVRFMEEWLRAADAIIEKLRLKSASLKAQISKAKHQLAQKEELGETLHPIDFEQLAIENHKYQEKIDRKNHHLLQMKKITGRCSLSLSNHKQKLAEQMAVLKSIKKEIARKQAQIEKFNNEEHRTAIDSEKAANQLRQITELMGEYTVPDLIEFVKMQDELAEMQRTYKRLQRHHEVQQNAIKAFKNQSKAEPDIIQSKKYKESRVKYEV
ncbi:coiled-coil domain-containing protein 113-like [Neodiprion virginianus]|uniref:coiled-coil domain-containing protein 113-like n=1 Tax=Neodiprion virginianus TaxID=2961670 RepID=UPI001EE6BD35|nr:coiled-coil domain-containing protein 113-like [Neodiprion virginianus]